MKRRDFLRATAAGPLLAALPSELLAQTSARPSAGVAWDSGTVRHLLPTVSDTQMLLKVSFDAPLSQGGSLFCVSPGNTIPGGTPTGSLVCPATYRPLPPGDFWSRLTPSISIGQAF